MSGDYSRQRFDPAADFGAVLMQQGRVQLDSDWNEWAAILDRRLRAETADLTSFEPNPDIRGVAVYPRLTPDAFLVSAAGGDLTIGRGRMYLDGMLVENHGVGALEFDPLLAEERGAEAVAYDAQPYHPVPVPLPGGGRLLAYLEAWQREIGALERPDLVEVAVGVDTTRRLQAVWQVRFLPNLDAAVECDTPDAQIVGWRDLIRPSAGRLTTRAVGLPPDQDPCELPPSGGFRGLENRLYRVEIHDPGPAGTATFKWSRDNATVAAAVTEVVSAHELRLDSLGRDSVLRFDTGDWVEIVDDRRELSGRGGNPALRHGDIRQITVDEDARTISFTPDLTDLLPSGLGGDTPAARHLRVQRWDQSRKVFDANGDEYFDLDGSDGVIRVPPAGTTLALEAGIEVTFSVSTQDGPGGAFRTGDYWTFAARTADASVEELDAAPPQGPHHHFARLAIVTLPGAVTDCRVAWPPEAVDGESCACTICISAEQFATQPDAIQRAVDALRDSGGSICLSVGDFLLREPVRIDGARAIRIRGQGRATQLAAPGSAFLIVEAADITLEDMSIITLSRADEPIIAAEQVLGLRLDRLDLTKKGASDSPPAVALSRVVTNLELRHCTVEAPTCVGARRGREDAYLSLQGAVIEQNRFDATVCAIDFGDNVLHGGLTHIEANHVRGGREASIRLTGATLDRFGVEVARNAIQCSGDGIVAGVTGIRVEANDLMPLGGRNRDPRGSGILLTPGLAETALENAIILANRIAGMPDAAISIEAGLASCLIKDNLIEACGDGIIFGAKASAESVSIENNYLTDIAADTNEEGSAPGAIRVLRAREAGIVGNVIRGVGVSNVQGTLRAGIVAAACETVRISGNHLTQIGPTAEFIGEAAGIIVARPFRHATVASNTLLREVDPNGAVAEWSAIVVGDTPGRDVHRLGRDTFTVRVDDNRTLLGTRNAAFIAASGAEDVAIEGNEIETSSRAPGIAAFVRGDLRVSDNRCVQRQPARGIVLAAATGVVSGNRVGGEPALVVSISPDRLAAVGNITSTRIEDPGGHPLPPPWDSLNVVA